MIKVTYIPCLFEDHRVEFETRNLKIPSILMSLVRKHPELREDSPYVSVRVNGKKLSPFAWKNAVLDDGDRVALIQDVGYEVIAFISAAVSYVGSLAIFIPGVTYGMTLGTLVSVVGVVSSVGFSIYNALSTPDTPRTGLGLNNSPTYGWDSIAMQVKAGVPVPVVYGEHIVPGNLISCFVSTDGEKNYLNMLIALCEGEIAGVMKADGSGVCASVADTPLIYINDNLYQNFQGVSWDYRLGTQDQTPINGFDDVMQVYNAGPFEIDFGVDYLYTTVASEVEAYEIRFRCPGFSWTWHGNYYPRKARFSFYHRVNGETDWVYDGQLEIQASTTNAVRRYFRKDGLAAAKYDIKVVRESVAPWPDPPEQSGPRDTYIDNVSEVEYDSLIYPHTALLALKVLASQHLSGQIPNVLPVVRGKKVLNLDTSVTEWTRSPIYNVNDLMVAGRFGLGRYISQANINNDRLIEEADHCDELVGDGTRRQIASITATSLTSVDYEFAAADVGRTVCCRSPFDGAEFTRLLITSVLGKVATGSGGWDNGTPELNTNKILNDGFETPGGGGADVFADWSEIKTGSSTITRDTSVFHAGEAACKFVIDAGGNFATVAQGYVLIPGNPYVVRLWHKESVNGSAVRRFDIRDSGVNVFLKEDGTWNAGPYFLNLARDTDWTEVLIEFFAHASYSNYVIYPHADDANNSTWFDDISILPKYPTSDWQFGEKRFELDMVLDSQDQAIRLIQRMCASFRASPVWSRDAIQIVIDKKETPSYLFTMGNVLKGSFRYSYASPKQKPNVIGLEYLDRDHRFQKVPVDVPDSAALTAGAVLRRRSFPLFGATRRSQIYREGRFHMLAAKYQDEQIQFGGGIDAVPSWPFDVIEFSHDVPQWGYGGRIVSATINTISIDREVEIEAGFTYVISIMQPGTGGTEVIETRTVTDGAGFYNTLNVTPNFSAIPAAYGLYAFGKQGIEAKPFRVMSVQRTPQNNIQLMASEYQDACYVDTDIILPDVQYSDLPTSMIAPQVENLQVSESGTTLDDGAWNGFLEVGFRIPEVPYFLGWDHAEVWISLDPDIGYQHYGNTTRELGYTIEGHNSLKIGNTVYVKVVLVTKTGLRADFDSAPYATVLISGKTSAPSDVTGFTAVQMGDRVMINWTPPEDRDIIFYEIREGPSWDTGQLIGKNITGIPWAWLFFGIGAYNLMIKAVDRTGNYSATPATAQITITVAPAGNLLKSMDGLLAPSAYGNTTRQESSKADIYGKNVVVGLTPSQGWDDAGNWDDASAWDVPVASLTGDFETDVIDFGVLTKINILADDDYVLEGGVQSATVEIKTSEDDITWGSYATFVAGEFYCRYAKFKISFQTSSASYNIFVTRFTVNGYQG
jgi:predicted phage tail protein